MPKVTITSGLRRLIKAEEMSEFYISLQTFRDLTRCLHSLLMHQNSFYIRSESQRDFACVSTFLVAIKSE